MEKIKIIITGSNGLLGQKLVQLFVANDFEVFAFSKGQNRNTFIDGYEYYNVNITSFERVTKLIHKLRPHFIINAAAMTNVDICEFRKRECEEINFRAVENMIEACHRHKVHLIQISTDFVFDGEKGFYTEDDKPNPVNNYGLSKYKAEKALKRSKIEHTILRTILVFGLVDNANKSNVVLWVKDSLEKKTKIKVVTDQYRMPTLSDDLADACLLAVQQKATGIYHISTNELMSIHEIALHIADTFKLDKELIIPITTPELRQKATRPVKTGFKIDKAIEELGFIDASFKERLQVFSLQL